MKVSYKKIRCSKKWHNEFLSDDEINQYNIHAILWNAYIDRRELYG